MADATPRCTVCKRQEGGGSTNRFGERLTYGGSPQPDLNPHVPLGAMETCPSCWTLSICPDCLHEGDCCYRVAEYSRERGVVIPDCSVGARMTAKVAEEANAP